MDDFVVRFAADMSRYKQGLEDAKRRADGLGAQIRKAVGIKHDFAGNFQSGFRASMLGATAAVGIVAKGLSAYAKESEYARVELDRLAAVSTHAWAAIGEAAMPVLETLSGLVEKLGNGLRSVFDFLSSGGTAATRAAVSERDAQSKAIRDRVASEREALRLRSEFLKLTGDTGGAAEVDRRLEFRDIGKRYQGVYDAANLTQAARDNATLRMFKAEDEQAEKLRKKEEDKKKAEEDRLEKRRNVFREIADLEVEKLAGQGYATRAAQARIVLDYEKRIADVMKDQTLSASERAALADKLAGLEASALATAGVRGSFRSQTAFGVSDRFAARQMVAWNDKPNEQLKLSRDQLEYLKRIAANTGQAMPAEFGP